MTNASLRASLENAVEAFRTGNLDTAGSLCSAVLADQPGNTDALHILGAIRLRQNDPATAVDLLTQASRRDGKNPEILANLGAAHRAAGEPERAAEILRRAVKFAPHSASAHLNLANAYSDARENAKAARHYARTVQLAPENLQARRRLADILWAEEDFAGAIEQYDALLALSLEDATVLNAAGALHAEAGNEERAENLFREARAIAPFDIDIAANLANILACRFDYDEALELYRKVIASRHGDADMLSNAANVNRRKGDIAAAEEFYRKAISTDAHHCDANAGLANCLLSEGRFAEGWRRYLERESVRNASGGLIRTALPENLSGKRVTILADQGLGDEIFFLRFVAGIKARGASVAYRPEPRLAAMLARAEIVDEILPADAGTPGDYVVAVGDLPFLLEMKDGDAPPPSIGLSALAEHEAALREKLENFGPAPWIGVTWRAGTANRRRLLFKESPADALAGALPEDATIVAVQRGARPGEIDAFAHALGRPVLDLSGANDDLETLLALSGLLDEYVAVSNTTVHLREALGKPTHVLIPAPPEFRWMAHGDESPWFPESPVYRQRPDGNWNDAFDTLAASIGR